jgi:TetR/AcrR family transcriptional regulator
MGVAERRQREREQRRSHIVDAAEHVLFTRGLATATMEDVAAEAELSKGTLYLYFENKHDLIAAIIIRGILILQSMFEEAAAGEEKGIDKVAAIGRAYIHFCHEHADYFRTMLQFETADVDPDEGGYGAQCVTESNRTFSICAGAVQHGIDDGTIRSDIDPLKTALTLYGLSTGLMQIISIKGRTIQENQGLDPSELIETFFDLIYKSLRA